MMKTKVTKRTIDNLGNFGSLKCFCVTPTVSHDKSYLPRKTHNILLIDTSESMSNDISALLNCVKKAICSINENDIITVISFNSVAEIKLSEEITKETIYNLGEIFSEKSFTCNGCTSFSNALEAVNTAYHHKEDITNCVNVLLFTDGMSCCQLSEKEDYNKSIKIIKSMINDGCDLINFSAIGFRNNININFLYDITSLSIYGTYLLSNNIKDYTTFFETNYNIIYENIGKSISFTFDERNSNDIYTLYAYGSTLQRTKLFKGSFKIDNLSTKKNKFTIINLSDTSIYDFKVDNEIIHIDDKMNVIPINSFDKTIYGFVKEFYYKKLQSIALDFAIFLKDKRLISTILNSYTLDEKRETLKFMKNCYLHNSDRYKAEIYTNDCITDENIEELLENQYCILDLLKDLFSLGFKYIPVTNYNRVSSKVVKSMESIIREDPGQKVVADMRDLVFNETRLNISIPYTIDCNVYPTVEDQTKYNLPEMIPTRKYRNQTLILNGNLNIDSFKVIPPRELVMRGKIIDSKTVLKYKKLFEYLNKNYYSAIHNSYTIDLKKNPLPVVTRNFKCLDEDKLLETVYNLTLAKARQKVYNAEISDSATDIMIPEVSSYGTPLGRFNLQSINEDQLQILKENYGLNDKLDFVGKPEVLKENDKYSALSIKFTIKGSTSLPSIAKFKEKLESGKKLNLVETEMKQAYENIKEAKTKNDLLYLKSENKALIHELSTNISISKIAKFLTGNTWSKFITNDKGKESYSNPELLENVELLMDIKWIEVEI